MRALPLTLWLWLLPALSPMSALARTPEEDLKLCDQLLADLSPASVTILDNPAYFARLREIDPGKASRLFREKVELRDMGGLVQYYPDANGLRQAFRGKAGPDFWYIFIEMGLGPEPQRLAAWVEKNFGMETARRFREALWSWDTLAENPRRFLSGRGLGASAWISVPFPERDTVLRGWAMTIFDEILSAKTPWTPEQRKEFGIKQHEIWGMLTREEQNRLGQRFARNDLLARELSVLKGKAAPPQIKAQLIRAADPGLTVEEQLAAVARPFDNSRAQGRVNPVELRRIDASRASRPSETLSGDQRDSLARMLPKAYLKLVGKFGSPSMIEFYKKNDPRIEVMDTPGALASYDPPSGSMRFNAKEVEAWLKLNHKSARDLLTNNKGTLESFVLQTSPVFVHEAVHQMQFAPLGPAGQSLHNQGFEIVAMFHQTVFSMKLAQEDPRFLDFVNHEQQGSQFALLYANLMNALKEGPLRFRQYVVSQHYAAHPSFEAVIAAAEESLERQERAFEAELKRRWSLSERPASKEEIEKYYRQGYAKADGDKRVEGLKSLSAPALRAMMAGLRQDEKSVQGWYFLMRRSSDQTSWQMFDFWDKTFARPPGEKK